MEEKTPVTLYQFEYQIIPFHIDAFSKQGYEKDLYIKALSDIEWLTKVIMPSNKLYCDFDTSEILVEILTLYDTNYIVVFKFPYPNRAPLAKYGGVVINSKGVKYYTLERSQYKDEEGWMLGSMSPEGNHSNYGPVNDCTSALEFAHLLENKGFLVKNLWCRIRKLFGISNK